MRALRWPRWWLGAWIALVLAVIVLSLIPPPDMQVQLPRNIDKVEHMLGYALLAFAALQLFAAPRVLVGIACGLVALGVGLEIAQGMLVPEVRTMDWHDAVANTFGVLLGFAPARTRLATLLLRRGG